MIILILTVVLGIAFAFFATQNTGHVSVYIGSFNLSNIPLYQVILGSIITALIVAGFIYFLKSLSSSLTINEKDDELKKTKDELAEITKEAHKLEIENTKLKSEAGEEEDENAI